MKNSLATRTNYLASQGVSQLMSDGGENALKAFLAWLAYDLLSKAIDDKYTFKVIADKEGKLSLDFAPPSNEE